MSLNKRLLHHFDHCLNCETALEEEAHFCPKCGQKRTTGRISFRQLIIQFFEDTFSWDARLFRSIRGLFSPGKLTEEYFKGRHIPFWQPLRLFLFMAALQMLVVNSTVSDINEKIQHTNDGIKKSVYEYLLLKKLDSLKTDVAMDFNNKKTAISAIDSLLKAYVHPEKFKKAKITKKILESKADSVRKTIIQTMKIAGQPIDSADVEEEVNDFKEGVMEGLNSTSPTDMTSDFIEIPFVRIKESMTPRVEYDSIGNLKRAGWGMDGDKLLSNKVGKDDKSPSLLIHKTDFITLSANDIIQKYHVEGFANQVIAKQTIKAMKDGKSGVEFFLSRLSWMIIIMMPVFAFFLELMNRPYYYVEHVIFSFHCHAFMFLLVSLVFFINHQLLPTNFSAWQSALNGLVALYLLYYFYKAMRRVYKQGRVKTLLKYTFLLFSYFFTMTFAVILTIIASFFFF